MIILLHRDFKKAIKRLPKSLRVQFGERVRLLQENPFHPLLCAHELSGAYQGLWSINITGDIRALYEIPEKGTMHFTHIGTHHQLYGN